jgi:transposase
MSYSMDLRSRVIGFLESGGSKVEAARIYSVSERTVYRWQKEGLQIGKPGPKGPTKLDNDKLRAAVAACPDAQQKELAETLNVDPSSINRAFKRLGITRKKNHGVRGKMLG